MDWARPFVQLLLGLGCVWLSVASVSTMIAEQAWLIGEIVGLLLAAAGVWIFLGDMRWGAWQARRRQANTRYESMAKQPETE